MFLRTMPLSLITPPASLTDVNSSDVDGRADPLGSLTSLLRDRRGVVGVNTQDEGRLCAEVNKGLDLDRRCRVSGCCGGVSPAVAAAAGWESEDSRPVGVRRDEYASFGVASRSCPCWW